jgi:hypothetical protein
LSGRKRINNLPFTIANWIVSLLNVVEIVVGIHDLFRLNPPQNPLPGGEYKGWVKYCSEQKP